MRANAHYPIGSVPGFTCLKKYIDSVLRYLVGVKGKVKYRQTIYKLVELVANLAHGLPDSDIVAVCHRRKDDIFGLANALVILRFGHL